MRRGRLSVVSAAVAFSAVLALWTPSAAGFKLPVHHAILVAGLPGLSPLVLSQIDGSLGSGAGNAGSDLFQLTDFRHFDNAANPAAVCELANRAWDQFTSVIVNDLVLGYAGDARSAFGALTHAFQDFYSHSNWLELGRRNLAPIAPTCAGFGLPSDLQTGYFRLTLSNPLSGCPHDSNGNPTPPPPFRYCHETLNKDDHVGHGADQLPEGGKTFHQAAVELAIAETQAVYNLVRAHVATAIHRRTHDLNGACVADVMFGGTQDPGYGVPPYLCLDLTGLWGKTSSSPPDVGGLQWGLTQSTTLDVTGFIQTQTCGQVRLTLHRDHPQGLILNGAVESCPLDLSGACPSRLSLPLTLRWARAGTLYADLTAIDVEDTGSVCRELGRTVQYITLQRFGG